MEVDQAAEGEQPDVAMFASACSFFTTYLPTFHSASSASGEDADHPENLPILDTGATHCLLPLKWLTEEECDQAKRIYLKVATGTSVRALLYNNVIYAKTVSRPLISVGQLKAMLDLRFLWDDASPLLLLCHAGRKYIILRARVVHHLPVISRHHLTAILGAISSCTTDGELWDLAQWTDAVGSPLEEFCWTNSPATPPGLSAPDHQEPQINFSSLDAPFLPAHDLQSSGPKIFDLENLDATTDDDDNDGPRTDDNDEERTQEHRGEMSTREAKEALLSHHLPKATTRTNVKSKDYVPQGRLFGAFTTRGEGITQASYRYPLVVQAIHTLAATRPSGSGDEGYLSAQLNRVEKLPIHRDRNNHGHSWIIGLGNYLGGRIWVQDPLGKDPPPHQTEPWHKHLRGTYHDIKDKWLRFESTAYHAVERVDSGVRTSLALFSPRSWTRIPPHALSELEDIGFFPPRYANHISSTTSGDDNERSTAAAPVATSERGEDIREEIGDKEREPDTLLSPTPEEEAALQEWCASSHVSLPFSPISTSDGKIQPLSPEDEKLLREHISSGHLTKCNLCKGCLLSEGPRRMHRRVRDVDRATHVLHIDIAGPLLCSEDKYFYYLVGALRLPDLPLLIDVRFLRTRSSVEVCDALEKMTAFF